MLIRGCWRNCLQTSFCNCSSSLSGSTSAIRSSRLPVEAILRQLAAGRHNLLVLGVSPRPGDTLFFGQVAAELVEKAECSLFLVTGEAFVPPADRDASLEGLNSKAQKAA